MIFNASMKIIFKVFIRNFKKILLDLNYKSGILNIKNAIRRNCTKIPSNEHYDLIELRLRG